MLFLSPYVCATPLFILDMSHLSGEIDNRGEIAEPETDENAIDLSTVTMHDIGALMLSIPLLLCYQMKVVLRFICRCCKTNLCPLNKEPHEDNITDEGTINKKSFIKYLTDAFSVAWTAIRSVIRVY